MNYDLSFVVTITVICYSWALSSGDHIFTCGTISRSPQNTNVPGPACWCYAEFDKHVYAAWKEAWQSICRKQTSLSKELKHHYNFYLCVLIRLVVHITWLAT